MSRYYNDYLQHGWGNKPEQKAKEKAYNAEYYKKNKYKWYDYVRSALKAVERGYDRLDSKLVDVKDETYYDPVTKKKSIRHTTKHPLSGRTTVSTESLERWYNRKSQQKNLNIKENYTISNTKEGA